MIFTAGLDRNAYIWDLNKQCRGKLIQGYMLKANYYWDFPLSSYTNLTAKRQDDMLESLKDIRTERDNDKTYKKLRETA